MCCEQAKSLSLSLNEDKHSLWYRHCGSWKSCAKCFPAEVQMAEQCPTRSIPPKSHVLTWMWPWGSVQRCSLWCGCCIRRKGLQTPSGWQGYQALLHSLFPQCKPQTAAGTTSHLDRVCSLRCTCSKQGLKSFTWSTDFLFLLFSFQHWLQFNY